MTKIFVVEDDLILKRELMKILGAYGYEALTSERYDDMVSAIDASKADLVLMDVNLPLCDGYALLKQLREDSPLPVIMLTSRESEMDELMSINLGADDYVTKPYNAQILMARIGAVLKRVRPVEQSLLTYKGVSLAIDQNKVFMGDATTELTKNESRILWLLMKAQGKIMTRESLMNALWQSDVFVDDNTLTVNVNRLRKKLEQIGIEDYIHTKRGQGYSI